MSTKISCKLNSTDLNKAIKELEKYRKQFAKKEKLFLEKIANIGKGEAEVRFTSAIYDGINDVDVQVEPRDNGYVVVARGEAVAFIEFGSGIYYNPSEPYPNPRPEGIVGIGEYGQGKGARVNAEGKAIPWVFKGEKGANSKGIVLKNGAIMTRGNPASMPMWYASEEIRRSILNAVKEVFK